MDNDKLMNGAAVFASGYVKRWLEQHYDALMRTAPARKLMETSAPTRYGIEASMYALLAYVDQHWSTRTPMRTLLRDVAIDAPAELSKRLVNGFREEVLAAAAKEKSEQTRGVERALLQLDDATLGPLLAWLARTTPEERATIRALLATLSDEELRKVARLEPQDLAALLSSSQSEKSPPPEKPPSRLAQAIRDELKQAHQRADAQLAARRARRQT